MQCVIMPVLDGWQHSSGQCIAYSVRGDDQPQKHIERSH